VASDTGPDSANVPSVVVVGSASRDLTEDDPRGWRLGGAVTYGALTLARLGLRTAAFIGVDEEAMHASELELLRRAGVTLVTVAQAHAPVFINEETATGRLQTVVDAGEPLPVTALPEDWTMAQGWLLGPVAGELGDDWANVPPAGATVAVGWQGLLRALRAGQRVKRQPPRRSALLRRANLVGVSADDVTADTPIEALAAFLEPGAELLLTAADRGGSLFRMPYRSNRPLRYPAVPADRVVDATGAGDVALAAMLAGRLTERAAPPELSWAQLRRRHLRLAAVAASFTVEQPGLQGVPDFAAVCSRLSARDAESQPA
jgi:sugar/nucleoside kinase (ribokinase family)